MNQLIVVFIFWATILGFPNELGAETPKLNCNNGENLKSSLAARIDYLKALHSNLNRDQILERIALKNAETIEILSYSPNSLKGKISGLSIYQVCTDHLNQFVKSPTSAAIEEFKNCTGDLYRDPKPSIISDIETCLLDVLKSSN